MARTILIDSLGWQDGLFNLGLAYLSSCLKEAGHQVHVIDLNNKFRTPEQVVEIIAEYKPQYVGFSVKSATFANAVELHRKIAAAIPGITFIYGGPHATLSAPTVLDEAPAAFFIKGDAELSFPDFIGRHARGESDFSMIAGMMYRNADGSVVNTDTVFHKKIDDLPLPDFTTFDTFASFKTYPLLTSRGCPYKCTYCSVPAISGSTWVYRSAPSILRELDHVLNFLKMKTVVIVDDNFTLHKKRAESICQAIIDSNYKFMWSCGNGIRADRIWPELAELMYRAGCVEVAFGIESLDADVFGQLTKGEEIKHVRHGIQVVQKAGLNVTGFFMIGLPGSTYRKDLRTLALARKLHLNNYYFGLTVPYPGTKLWDWTQENARFLVPWQNSYHISEVFRDGLEKLKLEPVFDTVEYPAEDRKKMFRAVLAAKERTQDRSLKVAQRRLRAVPGRPIIVMRTSRRDNLFRFFKDIQPNNPHVLLYKGNGDFITAMPAELRSAYEFVRIKGDGLTSVSDVASLPLERLKDAVVVLDIPSGNIPKYENLIEFARALKPCQIVALVGDKFELLSDRSPQAAVDEKLSLRSPEMEPVYVGIHQLPPQTVSSEVAAIQ